MDHAASISEIAKTKTLAELAEWMAIGKHHARIVVREFKRRDAAAKRASVRIEKALRAADRLAEFALGFNEGIDNAELDRLTRGYLRVSRPILPNKGT